MSRVSTGSVCTVGTTRSEDGGVRTADMESSEGIESEVKPMSIKALVAVSGRSSTIKRASNFLNIASNTGFRVLHS
jgi:hypothetical protein